MKATVIDLFAGVGGLSLGFKMAGFKITFANEYDESIAKSYKSNHPDTLVLVEDITKLSIKETFKDYKGKTDVIVKAFHKKDKEKL